MLNSYKKNNYYINNGSTDYTRKSLTNFAVGISAGGKFVTENGFVVEIYLGLGRNLINNSTNFYDNDVVGRAGISLGYRF